MEIGTTMFVKSTIASLLIVISAAASAAAPAFGEHQPTINYADFVKVPQGLESEIMILPVYPDEEPGLGDVDFPRYTPIEETPETEKAPAESAPVNPEPFEPVKPSDPEEKPSKPETEPEVQPTAPSYSESDIEAFRTHAGLRAGALSESFDLIRTLESQSLSGIDGLWAEASAVNHSFGAYDLDRNGLTVGMQKSSENFTIGAAFRFVDGEMNAYDWNALSASVYGSFATGSVRHVLTASYARHDLDGTAFRTDSIFGSYKADMQLVAQENTTVSAYAGIRGVHMRDEANQSSSLYQLPVGVRASVGTVVNETRFSASAYAEGAYTGGDRALKLGSVETASFASVRSVAAGVEASIETERFALTASYQIVEGSDDNREHRGMVKAGLRF